MKYTWLVERVKAVQGVRDYLGVGYIEAVSKYNEIIEFLDTTKILENEHNLHNTSLDSIVFGLRYRGIISFETQDDVEDKKEQERRIIVSRENKKAQEWFDKQTDFDKEMINRLIKMNQIGPVMG